jgi:TolB protein
MHSIQPFHLALTRLLAFVPLLAVTACRQLGNDAVEATDVATAPPVAGAVRADHLIQPGEERYFSELWQVTFGGQNAEAYWSFGGDRLALQITDPSKGMECDRIFVTSSAGDVLRQISSGRGVTTCSYFLPGDEEVLYASTHMGHDTCPQKPRSEGYIWMVWPDYDIYVAGLAELDERPLVTGYGYDAEATVSPRGDRIVFTSTRSGDLELWTCDLEGGDLRQVTETLGYDGGAFFSHDGQRLVFRATQWTPGAEETEHATYRDLLARWMVRPQAMEIHTIGVDGNDRRQVTALGGASFAPFFHPDDQRIIFASNHHTHATNNNFDLFSIRTDGSDLRRITTFDGPPGKHFDGFPMFSPNGEWLAFSSNRGDGIPGDTNVFIARWKGL